MSSALEQAMLATLFDAPAPMTIAQMEAALRCTRRDLWQAIRAQHLLGNVKKGDPIALTASARIAIGAGRLSSNSWRPDAAAPCGSIDRAPVTAAFGSRLAAPGGIAL